jgi:hypothetical protein
LVEFVLKNDKKNQQYKEKQYLIRGPMLHDMVHDMVHDIGGDMLHLLAGFTEIDLWVDLRVIFRTRILDRFGRNLVGFFCVNFGGFIWFAIIRFQ